MWSCPRVAKQMIRLFDDVEELSNAAAEEFLTLAREAISARGRFVVALAGGATPRRLYRILAETPFDGWNKVQFFWGDERAVPPDHADSNYRMAKEAMLDALGISSANIHRINAEHEAAASDYAAMLWRMFGRASPVFDLVILGMGADGHTASLFPGTDALKEAKHWVVASRALSAPKDRITLTAPILNRAAQVIFLVAGADKADALAEVLEGPSVPERLPAQLISSATWFVDRAAGSKLKKRSPA